MKEIRILSAKEYMSVKSEVGITDNYIVNGGTMDNLIDEYGLYWVDGAYGETLDTLGSVVSLGKGQNYRIGFRPAILSSMVPKIFPNRVKDKNGFEYFGGYLNSATDYSEMYLQREYQSNKEEFIDSYSSRYTRDFNFEMLISHNYDNLRTIGDDEKYSILNVPKYRFKNGIYSKLKSNFDLESYGVCCLSDGCPYENGEYVWLKLEPIRWMRIGKYHVTTDIIGSGVPDNKESMDEFLNKHFLREIINSDRLLAELKGHKSRSVNNSHINFKLKNCETSFEKLLYLENTINDLNAMRESILKNEIINKNRQRKNFE